MSDLRIKSYNDSVPPELNSHSLPLDVIVQVSGTSISDGLTEREAQKRLKEHRPASFKTHEKSRIRQLLTGQLSNIVVWLLGIAALVAWLAGNELEAYAILVVIVLNALIGFAIEYQAGRALDALRRSTITTARVRRDGRERIVDAANLVEGDVIIVAAGDRVPGDSRIVEAVNLRVDESTLTGESEPVDKRPEAVESSTPLAERTSMIHLGSTVVAGHGLALVTALGVRTEIGKIGDLVSHAATSKTPLEKRLTKLGKRLVYVVLGIAAVVLAAGIIRGDGFWLMIEVAISLSVAAVPEGLPAVTTLILALGVLRMARRNAIVRRLSAVETLGSSTVICSDKTGTLTENRMTVTEFRLGSGERIEIVPDAATNKELVASREGLRSLLRVGVLCNEASDSVDDDGQENEIGDPTETALLTTARTLGVNPAVERARNSIIYEEPFEASKKRMIVVFENEDGNRFSAIKGAPAVVIEACGTFLDEAGKPRPLDEEKVSRLLAVNREMAGRALRVLAFAEKSVDYNSNHASDLLEDNVFLGFAGIRDPIRKGATEAIAEARGAGIRVVMLTGDQLNTARAIAADLDIAGGNEIHALHSSDLAGTDPARISELASKTDVFARVTPEDKLRIVKALQTAGEIVAVTGDGVNDAPALKQADIGVAMGLRGTEVAKEASDIVLTDDDFSTIVEAIRGGRTIYANILKFVHLMFSQNLSEVLVIFAAILVGLPLPLMPLQILWINLVTDVFPALALAVEPPSPDLMERKPFPPEQSMMSGGFMFRIFWQGILLASIALGAYLWALNNYGPGPHSRTVALMAVVGVQFGHLFNCRSRSRSAFDRFLSNPYIFAAALIVLVLQILAVSFPPLVRVLDTVPPNANDMFVIAVTVALPIVIVELTKLVSRRRG